MLHRLPRPPHPPRLPRLAAASAALALTLAGCAVVEQAPADGVAVDGVAVDGAQAELDVEPTPEAAESETPDTSEGTDEEPSTGTAAAALATLTVKGRAPMTGYDRDMFGPAWMDTDRNGCDTRNDVLATYLLERTVEGNGCVVTSGLLDDPYTGTRIRFVKGHGSLVDIDHVVALGNSWATGSLRWTMQQRAAFANDPLNLLPVDASANRQKGDGDAATWLPAHKPFRCAYVARQVTVKQKYDLWVTAPEAAAIERVLATCPGEPLAEDTAQLPTATDQVVREPVRTPTPTPTPEPAPAPAPVNVYYENCTAARAAGAAPVRVGDPGYGRHLDRDGDGVGCE